GVRLNEPKLTADGRLPKRALAQLNQQLVVKLDEDDAASVARFNFLLAAAGSRELVVYGHDRLVPGDELAEWEGLSFAEQARVLMGWWLHDQDWLDPSLGLMIAWAGATHVKGRQRLVSWLSRLKRGAWYRLGDLLETIKQRDPMILRSRPEVIRFLGYHGLEQL